MSLQFIIDGNNIINHAQFTRINKRIKNRRLALLDLIKIKKLTGSHKNQATVVFDGYPQDFYSPNGKAAGIDVIFSRHQTADERINKIAEQAKQPLNTVVVSDDRQIRLFAKSLRCRVMAVEEFILPKKNRAPGREGEGLIKPELNYTQIHKINEELGRIWLK